ncbi:transposable element Tcb2 transposase [Trichonephila clavipes]|nr:transposable element Tcb2 transposase [Trichonephila clavipes]
MSFTRRRRSGLPRQTSSREDHCIIRNACVQPTASSAAIQVHVNTFTRRPCVFSNHTNVPGCRTLGIAVPLRVLPLTPTHRRLRLEWCCARGNWTAAEWNQVV